MSHSKLSIDQPEQSSERLAERQGSTAATDLAQPGPSREPDVQPRIRHTPAMRNGPPLSCNYCWNTVDDCGRILRRKTQYHCPECRTNLCIVPCFHQYHDGTPERTVASARYPTALRRAAQRLAAIKRMDTLNNATSSATGPASTRRRHRVASADTDPDLKPRVKYTYTYTIMGQLYCFQCKRPFKKKFGFQSHARAHRRKTEAAVAMARHRQQGE